MTKRDAVRLSNLMAGTRPTIVKTLGQKFDSFAVEHSVVYENPNHELLEHRERIYYVGN